MKILIETHSDTEPRIVTVKPGKGSEKSKVTHIEGDNTPKHTPREDTPSDNKWRVNGSIVYSDTLEGIRKKYSNRSNTEVTKGYRPIPHKKKGEGYYIYLQKKKGK